MDPILIEIGDDPTNQNGENSLCADDFLQVYIKEDNDKVHETNGLTVSIGLGGCLDCYRTTSILDSDVTDVKDDLVTHFMCKNDEPEAAIRGEYFSNPNSTCTSDLSSFEESDLEELPPAKTEFIPFQCILCGKTFQKRRNLRKHIITHSQEKPFKCEKCGKNFARGNHLKRHMLIHLKERTKVAGEDSLTCSICGKTISCIGNFKKHLKTHMEDKPHKCDTCTKSFVRLRDLKRHQRRHTGEKPFPCSICGTHFRLKETLTRHLLTHRHSSKPSHSTSGSSFNVSLLQNGVSEVVTPAEADGCKDTGENNDPGDHFKCETCDKTFKHKENLRKHITTHSENKRHKCDCCEKGFLRLTDLRRHSFTHTDDKPFSCVLCNISYRQVDSLKRHLLTH